MDVSDDGAETVAEPRWLTPAQQVIWRTYVRITQCIWSELDGDLSRQYGMSLSEYEVLAHLSEATDRQLRMSELAQLACQSKSRLTHTVRRLEERGYVTRNSEQTDRRVVLCCLTAAGLDKLLSLVPVHVESVQRRLFDPLSAEQQAALGEVLATWDSANCGAPGEAGPGASCGPTQRS